MRRIVKPFTRNRATFISIPSESNRSNCSFVSSAESRIDRRIDLLLLSSLLLLSLLPPSATRKRHRNYSTWRRRRRRRRLCVTNFPLGTIFMCFVFTWNYEVVCDYLFWDIPSNFDFLLNFFSFLSLSRKETCVPFLYVSISSLRSLTRHLFLPFYINT